MNQICILFTYYNEPSNINALNLLPEKFLNQAERFKAHNRKLEFLTGRRLLSLALRELDRNQNIENIEYDNSGKPFFIGGPFFSISHSKGIAACAASNTNELGLDIEIYREIKIDNFNPWFTKEAISKIKQSDKPELELIRQWTIKEALYKAGGDSAKEKDYKIISPQINDNYSTAIATKGEYQELIIKRI
ncbi:MAG: 4'-phosphopantetheinyl transferase superfamily protein [Spirochaetales bacterium]|nr:4'-phosphopantetheinyl transferase superfamily protein [Spirochaetales bacterium]